MAVTMGWDNLKQAPFGSGDSGYFLMLPPLAGDYNGDGIVDAADYSIWRDS